MSLPASSQLKHTLEKEKTPSHHCSGREKFSSAANLLCPVLSLLSNPKLLGYIQLIRNGSSSMQTWVSPKGMVNTSPLSSPVSLCSSSAVLVAASCSQMKGNNIPSSCEMIHRQHLRSSDDSQSILQPESQLSEL